MYELWTDFLYNRTAGYHATGLAMLAASFFTLWPQALKTYRMRDASGLSSITCIVGLGMSALSFSHATSYSDLYFWATYGSNTLASGTILWLKLKYDRKTA